jgi:pimeloyl-ACP methyl ester carboxylesterase
MRKQYVRYKSVAIDGTNISYREAGSAGSQSIILLNGMPNASGVFEELMDELKRDYYMVAPDLPGPGYSDAPTKEAYACRIENVSVTIERFMQLIGLVRPSVYVVGCGGAVALRIAMRHSDVFRAFIVQNSSAYEEGEGAWLRARQPKMLLLWGKNDAFFPTVVAEGFKDDVPGTKLYLYNTGHLVLEEYHKKVAENIRFFLG